MSFTAIITRAGIHAHQCWTLQRHGQRRQDHSIPGVRSLRWLITNSTEKEKVREFLITLLFLSAAILFRQITLGISRTVLSCLARTQKCKGLSETLQQGVVLHLLSVACCHLIRVSAASSSWNLSELGIHHISASIEVIPFASSISLRSLVRCTPFLHINGNLGGSYLATTSVNTRAASSFLFRPSIPFFDKSMS